MNNTIQKTSESENKTVISNTGETRQYLQVDAPHFPSKNIGTPIHVGYLIVKTMQSRKPCLLDLSMQGTHHTHSRT